MDHSLIIWATKELGLASTIPLACEHRRQSFGKATFSLLHRPVYEYTHLIMKKHLAYKKPVWMACRILES